MNNWDNNLYPMFKIIIPFQLLLFHHYCRLLVFAVFLPSLLYEEYNSSRVQNWLYTLHVVSRNASISLHSIANNTTTKWTVPKLNTTSPYSISNSSAPKTVINIKKSNDSSKRFSLQRLKLEVDYDFAKRLRQAQKNINVPMVNDIVVSKRNNSWAVYVIINNGNTRSKRYMKYSSYNVELLLNGKTYQNVFSQVKEGHLRVLKYEVPSVPLSGTVSLFDRTIKVRYGNLPYKALTSQPKRKIAVCAYISNYNTVNEIKSMLAFYILQSVDNVILYCTMNCANFKQTFKLEIQSGFVILYEYPWPLTRKYGLFQRSIQGSHINSCYYRHRDYFEYIISQDVDEYFYSEQYPYDLYKAIRGIFALNPGKRSLAVFLYC